MDHIISVKILATIMKTRSQSAQLLKQTKETFTAAFFDESSKCWMENKKRKKNGDYVYKPNIQLVLIEGPRNKRRAKK